jgi:hypothetical protein
MDAAFEASALITQSVITEIIFVEDPVRAGDRATEAAVTPPSSCSTVRRELRSRISGEGVSAL